MSRSGSRFAVLAAGAAVLGAWLGRRTVAPEQPASPAGPAPASSASDAELADARSRIAELEQATKQQQIEFGRLESGALHALDETIAKGQEREKQLAEELEQARTRLRATEGQLDVVQRRFESMQESLAQRDARVAELNEQLSDRERRT